MTLLYTSLGKYQLKHCHSLFEGCNPFYPGKRPPIKSINSCGHGLWNQITARQAPSFPTHFLINSHKITSVVRLLGVKSHTMVLTIAEIVRLINSNHSFARWRMPFNWPITTAWPANDAV